MRSFPDIPVDDVAMTLQEACAVYFRGADITPETLRAEARRGNLTIRRIGRRDWVTHAAMRKLVSPCQDQPKAPGSSSSTTGSPTPEEEPASSGSGSSATGRSLDALAAASSIANELKKGLRPTSPESSGPQSAKVISPDFQSRRS